MNNNSITAIRSKSEKPKIELIQIVAESFGVDVADVRRLIQLLAEQQTAEWAPIAGHPPITFDDGDDDMAQL